MSISINDSTYGYLSQTLEHSKSAASADSVSGSISGINENSSEEEMKQAIKDFESYFVEQVLKNVKKSVMGDEESSNDQLTSFYMDSVTEKMADQIVDSVGNRMTQTLYEQMCRNYNIPVVSQTTTNPDSTQVAVDLATSEVSTEE